MTAFRGPNLNRRGRRGFSGTASLFCAADSGMLTLGRSCCEGWLICSGDNLGGIELFASGFPPAIEVSGTPALRGGTGICCRVCG